MTLVREMKLGRHVVTFLKDDSLYRNSGNEPSPSCRNAEILCHVRGIGGVLG